MKKSCYSYCLVFLLTVLDIVYTTIGLKMGIIEEANPVMDYFLTISYTLSILVVLLFVGAILVFMYKASFRIPWINLALKGIIVIKVYVLMMHFNWIINCL